MAEIFGQRRQKMRERADRAAEQMMLRAKELAQKITPTEACVPPSQVGVLSVVERYTPMHQRTIGQKVSYLKTLALLLLWPSGGPHQC